MFQAAAETARCADGWSPVYCVSKNGVERSHFAAALPVAVNSVCPGWVRTDMGGASRSVEEGADGIVWLAAQAPQNLTGKFLQTQS